jgi:hypothetical protein
VRFSLCRRIEDLDGVKRLTSLAIDDLSDSNFQASEIYLRDIGRTCFLASKSVKEGRVIDARHRFFVLLTHMQI